MAAARGSTKAERKTKRYAAWRAAVFRRDGHRCRACGSKKNIQAHHKKPFALSVSLRYEVSNGTTLCSLCHEKIHAKRPVGVPPPPAKHGRISNRARQVYPRRKKVRGVWKAIHSRARKG